MTTHLGRAIRILDEARRLPTGLARDSIDALASRTLLAIHQAYYELIRVEAGDDVRAQLDADQCHATENRLPCSQPADIVDDDGFGWCAQHAPRCGQCDARPAEVVSPDCVDVADALASPLVCRDCACDSEQAAADERRERGEGMP